MSHYHNICGINDSSLQFNLYTIFEQKIKYSIFWKKKKKKKNQWKTIVGGQWQMGGQPLLII